ncbi:hypothetical protein BC777_1428 [Yoonia maricola]|uniref:Uncharacterized protein n=1 Tax=Yoonia maricola TaxID=420999 RepID=A0A2M8WNR7_9RHOB|nr:hypothetical protein [Yoonia maricola]PJI92574.1 hypothetical protein BC777_1428 [Yoonia maricola]
MRLIVLATALLPMGAYAQEVTLPNLTKPMVQSQSCPVGMTWDQTAGTCAEVADTTSPIDDLSDRGGCSYEAPREVIS